jgi:hypothetical protein
MRARVVQAFLDQNPQPASHLTTEAPVGSPNPEPVVIEPVSMEFLTVAVEALTVRVDRLGRDNDRLTAENRTLREWQINALGDAEKFCTVLSEIADRKELCSEFEEAIERANEGTRVLEFESTRAKSVEVQVQGTVTIPFSVSVTVEVSSSGSDAEELAAEYVQENYTPRSLSRDYYSDDGEIEVEECEVQ